MNKFIPKEVIITCKTCQKPGIIPLKNSKAEKEFQENEKGGFNCGKCAIEYWDNKFRNKEAFLSRESKNFQETYWELKTKLTSHE